jgi:hypothetical protein
MYMQRHHQRWQYENMARISIIDYPIVAPICEEKMSASNAEDENYQENTSEMKHQNQLMPSLTTNYCKTMSLFLRRSLI